METNSEELTLKLDIYEGPLDLLLHLIKRNEVDIYDIPISLITTQYLEYIEAIQTLNLDMVGDFLIMAATLTHIKSKMLLPATDEGKDDQPTEDPRMELVRPLLEYAAFQQAAEKLASRPILERDIFTRGGDGLESLDFPPGQKLDKPEPLVVKCSSYELVKAWRQLIDQSNQKDPTLKFFMETVTIGEKINQIRLFLIETKTAHFQDLVKSRINNFDLALCFLAILELARTGFLRLWQEHDLDQSGPKLFLTDPSAAANLENLDYS
jgi:segregation and condensation protein A